VDQQWGVGKSLLDVIEGYSGIASQRWRMRGMFRMLEKGVQWSQQSSTTRYEPVAKVHQAKAFLQLVLCVKKRKFPNYLHFLF